MNIDYAHMDVAPIFLLPLMAILSVPLLTASMMIALQGLILVHEKRMVYCTILIVLGLFAALFIPAVITYRWFGIETPYDVAYHTVGYLGSIVLCIVVGIIANNDSLRSRRLFLLAAGASVGFLLFSGLFLQAPAHDSQPQIVAPAAIGSVYASIQVILPVGYYMYLRKHKESLMQQRASLVAQVAQTVVAPTGITQQPQPPMSQQPGVSMPAPQEVPTMRNSSAIQGDASSNAPTSDGN